MEIHFNGAIDESRFDHIVYAGDGGLELTVVASAGLPCFQDARGAGHIAYIGFGNHVFVFNSKTKELASHQVDGYFGHMYDRGAFEQLPARFSVLATSASEVLAFSSEGELVRVWPNLGIDGVLLHAVTGEQIEGEGEYDPPGSWRKFSIPIDPEFFD